jgi:hypothetical protein
VRGGELEGDVGIRESGVEGGFGVREGGVGISNVGGESMGVKASAEGGCPSNRLGNSLLRMKLRMKPQKKRKLDPEFLSETPDRRGLAEFSCKSNGQYVGHTSQLQAFIDQINATSTCATSGCNGQLKPVSIILTGLGGSVEVQYDYWLYSATCTVQ